MMVRGATTQQLIDTSNSLLDLIITQSETVFIPPLFQPDINSLLDGLPEVCLIYYLDVADASNSDYLVNAGSAVLVDTFTQSILDHPEGKLAELEGSLSDHVMGFVDKFIVLRQHDILEEFSASNFVSIHDVPFQSLGDITFLRFDDRDLTSLFGSQHISNATTVGLCFNDNFLFGPIRDVQFPDNPFGGFENALFILLCNNSTLQNLPSDLFDYNPSIQNLNLANIGLSHFSDSLLSGVDTITTLSLDQNKLTEFSHQKINDLAELELLSVGFNQISTLPEDLFAGISRIEFLSFQDNSLLEWPVSLLDPLIDLEELHLENNALDAFDPNKLPDGLHIYLQGNNITQSQVDLLEEKFPDVTFDI